MLYIVDKTKASDILRAYLRSGKQETLTAGSYRVSINRNSIFTEHGPNQDDYDREFVFEGVVADKFCKAVGARDVWTIWQEAEPEKALTVERFLNLAIQVGPDVHVTLDSKGHPTEVRASKRKGWEERELVRTALQTLDQERIARFAITPGGIDIAWLVDDLDEHFSAGVNVHISAGNYASRVGTFARFNKTKHGFLFKPASQRGSLESYEDEVKRLIREARKTYKLSTLSNLMHWAGTTKPNLSAIQATCKTHYMTKEFDDLEEHLATCPNLLEIAKTLLGLQRPAEHHLKMEEVVGQILTR